MFDSESQLVVAISSRVSRKTVNSVGELYWARYGKPHLYYHFLMPQQQAK